MSVQGKNTPPMSRRGRCCLGYPFRISFRQQPPLLMGNQEDRGGGHACQLAPQLCPLPWWVQAFTAGQAARTGRQFFSSLGQVKQQNSLVQKNIALSWGRAVEETKVEPQWFTTENRENLISALAALTIFVLSVLIPPVLIKCPGRDTYRFRFFAPSKYNSEVITENYTELNRNSAQNKEKTAQVSSALIC